MFVIDQLKKGDGALQKLALIILCAMVILLARLWFVQVVKAKDYRASHDDQSFRTVRIPPVRGKIVDRNGLALAENRASYNISLYLDELRKQFQAEYPRFYRAQTNALHRKLTKPERDALEFVVRYAVVSNLTAKLGAQIGQPISIVSNKFHTHYNTRRILPFPVLQSLTSAQIARFQEQPFNASGLDLQLQPTRLYPQKQAGTIWLGYLTPNNDSAEGEKADFDYRLPDYKGEIGLEGYFDEELHGRGGVKFVTVNRLGYRQHESIETPAEPGKNVLTTIDLTLQLTANKALRSSVIGPEAKAAAVVMNVQNGDILAMASNPSFDPNAFITGISSEEMLRLNDELLKPQLNRAVQEIYPPGSIFKIISGLAELEGGLDPNEIYQSAGYYALSARSKIDDTAPAGPYDFRRAFAKSSNSYFIHHGLRVGIRQLVDMGSRFGLGEPTEVPLKHQDKRGFFPTMQWINKNGWSDGDTANLCIGQGRVAVTPLQMAVMTSAIANGGKVFYPRLVQKVEPQEDFSEESETQTFPTRLRGELGVRSSSLRVVQQAMLDDTESSEGTAFKAFHEADQRTPRLKHLRVCGKTGTAEVKRAGIVVRKVVWFVSYAPVESPRYAVVVMIDTDSGGSGGGTCAPVAEKIYQEIERMENPGKTKDQLAGL